MELEKASPMVVAVMLARRPSIQEKGRDMAIALDPISETCPSITRRISYWLWKILS